MDKWIRWVTPISLVMSIGSTAHAVQYQTLEEAQKQAFPSATQFSASPIIFRPADIDAIEHLSGQKPRTQGEQMWKAEANGKLLGFFFLDYVIGKHLIIDYAVSLGADGKVRRVDILEYRESYGSEITNRNWLEQFSGKSSQNALELNKDIRNISGATLSSRHVTEGVKRVLAIYETCLR